MDNQKLVSTRFLNMRMYFLIQNIVFHVDSLLFFYVFCIFLAFAIVEADWLVFRSKKDGK